MSQELQYKEEQVISPIEFANGSDKCFKIYTEPSTIESYLCMKTGFSTNSKLKIGSSELTEELNKSPELIRAVQFYDEDLDLVWIPTIMNIPNVGMLFPEGNLEGWGWSFAPIVDIPEDEREKYPVPEKDGEFYTNKLDIDNTKKYQKNEFDKALIDMGVISEDFKGSLMNAK